MSSFVTVLPLIVFIVLILGVVWIFVKRSINKGKAIAREFHEKIKPVINIDTQIDNSANQYQTGMIYFKNAGRYVSFIKNIVLDFSSTENTTKTYTKVLKRDENILLPDPNNSLELSYEISENDISKFKAGTEFGNIKIFLFYDLAGPDKIFETRYERLSG